MDLAKKCPVVVENVSPRDLDWGLRARPDKLSLLAG